MYTEQNWPYCLRCSAQCGSWIVYVRYNRQCRLDISTQYIFRFFNQSQGHRRATDDIIAPFQSRRFIDTQTRDAFTSSRRWWRRRRQDVARASHYPTESRSVE
uniref:Uncharacterized protein n=1 Tax=Trichogramma kaykai TaxID=54128 RepID=A0ABD2X1H8_9HYME